MIKAKKWYLSRVNKIVNNILNQERKITWHFLSITSIHLKKVLTEQYIILYDNKNIGITHSISTKWLIKLDKLKTNSKTTSLFLNKQYKFNVHPSSYHLKFKAIQLIIIYHQRNCRREVENITLVVIVVINRCIMYRKYKSFKLYKFSIIFPSLGV